MRISGKPEVGKATQSFLLVSALAILATGCTSQSSRIGGGTDTMTTGAVSGVPQYQTMVPPENVGTGSYQGLPSQSSGPAVVSNQPINTATTAGSGRPHGDDAGGCVVQHVPPGIAATGPDGSAGPACQSFDDL